MYSLIENCRLLNMTACGISEYQRNLYSKYLDSDLK